MPLPTNSTSRSHTHSWAQLDELVVDGNPAQAVSRLREMNAHSRERMLVAGVGVVQLVGGAAVVLPGAGGGR